MKWHDSRTVERVALRAIQAGATPGSSLRHVEWDVSGKCQKPVLVELRGRPTTKRGGGVFPLEGKHMSVDLWTKCRKCDPCLHSRRLVWQDRGRVEYASSTRTWLLTLTNNPTRHAHQLALVRRYLAKQGVDYDGLAFGEQFSLRAAEMGKEVTKFLKRLRKNSAAPFRYLAVTEMHQSGAPHVHVLLHEQDIARPLRKDMIQSCWHDGFSNAKLVKEVRQAVYVCKYLSKTKVARVRASLKYGSNESIEMRTEQSMTSNHKNSIF